MYGCYHRASLTESTADGRTIVYSDRTTYSAYAERCRPSTKVVNRVNGRPEKALTEEQVKAMNLHEFGELVTQTWVKNKDVVADEIDPATTRKFLTRDINSGHWELRRRPKRTHSRPSTVVNTPPAHLYDKVQEGDTTTQTKWFDMSFDARNQLYRAYVELICYVPWENSPEETFIKDETERARLKDTLHDPECDKRYNRQRLEAFHDEYMRRFHAGEIAPAGSQWKRSNQFSLTLFLSNRHNIDVKARRAENDGRLDAEYEADDELVAAGVVNIRPEINDETDECENASYLNFVNASARLGITQQDPLAEDLIRCAVPMSADWQWLEEAVMVDKLKLFMARPPPSKVKLEDMTFMQRKAVELATNLDKYQVLYLYGKAGSGKTEVALKICELLQGQTQAGSGTGKASSLYNGPTLHGMFGWGYDRGYGRTITDRQAGILRTFYENVKLFIVDEISAVSAEDLADLDETMTKIFNPDGKMEDGEDFVRPFGSKKIVFLGDPAQLRAVCGSAIYDQGRGSGRQDSDLSRCGQSGEVQEGCQRTGALPDVAGPTLHHVRPVTEVSRRARRHDGPHPRWNADGDRPHEADSPAKGVS